MPYSTAIRWLAGGLACCWLACQSAQPVITEPPSTALEEAPSWAHEVVWYQIFVERFRNGDPSNDPTPTDLAGSYPGFVPQGWGITPWGHDWYEPDPWFGELENRTDANGNPITSFSSKLQLRRYGGDLQGVLDQIDYLDSLGVSAIYFNPLNDAPSLHKYDPAHWRHIDHAFGPSPKEDLKIMAQEDPADPSTWKMTGADKLFVNVIEAFHQRGIRVILDYSWNHTGKNFWALQDVAKNGEASPYKDWYEISSYDDPATEENEFVYNGWIGISELPEIKETVKVDHSVVHAYEGDMYSESAKQHIFNVSKRWLDPNGDGDPSDGVDGYRLDVAAEIGLEFWRDYRKEVRAINPDAYLLGEIWWKKFPDDLLDPAPFLKGDVFDAVMNYRWYRAVRHFFAQAPNKIPVSELVDSLASFTDGVRQGNQYAMMNLAASHDVPRVGTSLFNKNKYKYEAGPGVGRNYRIDKPDAETRETQKLLLIQQFTYIGAPHIWAGDEMGMWGADDPDCRKPLIWPDLAFENERSHPLGMRRKVDEVSFDNGLFDFYQQLTGIRSSYSSLRTGGLEYVLIDDERELLGYRRFNENEEVLVVFNAGTEDQSVSLPVQYDTYKDVFGTTVTIKDGKASFSLAGRWAAIIVPQ